MFFKKIVLRERGDGTITLLFWLMAVLIAGSVIATALTGAVNTGNPKIQTNVQIIE